MPGPPGHGPVDLPGDPRDISPSARAAAGSGGATGGAAPWVRLTAWVDGQVQGVGFRWWVRAHALELGLAGSATNLADGRVEVVAEGPRPVCARLLALMHGAAPPGRVTNITTQWDEPGECRLSGFVAG
jgi:acylphosphatase